MIRERIWNELCDAKKSDFYLSGYLSHLRTKRKRFNMYKIIFAIGGIVINQWVPNSSLVVLFILTLLELLKDIIPQVSVDEKLMDKLPEYRMLYVYKFEQLDKLFLYLENSSLTDSEAMDEYLKIRKIDIRIEDLDNTIHLPVKRRIFENADLKLKVFISNMYDTEDGNE